ncbi:DUF883 family protein [Wenzhouxiangella sediminis]|jgi:ElaB/YqjD/DUF883 family membrane-anchored ribosome-binding protein|uniref:DUF883 family protein n=1 Tax=Wenzhouxiangella sediminis TaxID=1792836 RepID=A0A3E1K994_9GAMM|nr:DUF883 family protein [Wenzhouxiangella sediminis]MEE4303254.1 DUF883 family protein [Wenzhouxiangella sp.]RFF30679.1 DUF883 family protein [Wenzhouxiangella sediminis]
MATGTDKELQELREEFNQLKDELSGIGKTVRQLAHTATDEGRDRLRSAAEHSRQQARETWSAFEHEVEERPMTSIAVALGIGFILGKLLDR